LSVTISAMMVATEIVVAGTVNFDDIKTGAPPPWATRPLAIPD